MFVGKVRTSLYTPSVKIYELLWLDDRVTHIAAHAIDPEEVEEVCFGQPFVQRAKSFGKNPVYYILGQRRPVGIYSVS